MPDKDLPPFLEPFARMMRFWTEAATAPSTRFTQPILPDWSLIRVDETNSSAPATEQAIVAKESYGRQLGRVMDALAVLIEERPDKAEVKAFAEFLSLKSTVDGIKCAAAADRIDRLRGDLDLLRRSGGAGYDKAVDMLRSVAGSLGSQPDPHGQN